MIMGESKIVKIKKTVKECFLFVESEHVLLWLVFHVEKEEQRNWVLWMLKS